MKICPRCNAVHDGHRWISQPDKRLMKSAQRSGAQRQLCPGCLRVERGQVDGVVVLKGAFLQSHLDEIRNVVKRVTRKRRHRNTASRVVDIRQEDGGLIIETTDEHLAERIGKEVEKAFKGDLRITWQQKDHFVRVVWQRE